MVPGGCTGPLVGGTCTLRFFNPCNGSTPEEHPCHFQPPLQQQTSGGRVWRGPNCFDVSRPVVPGGVRHTWGAVQLGSHRSSSRPAIVSTQPPPLPYTPNQANLATKLEPFQALSVLISGDWINLCKLRPQLQLHLHLKRQKTVGESFPRPTIYPLNRSIPSQRQPEHSCQDLNLTCEISILNSLA